MTLACEFDRLLQMHQGNVSLLSSFVVVRVYDDTIHSSGLNIRRGHTTLCMETENGQPRLEVNVFPEQLNWMDGPRQGHPTTEGLHLH